MALVYSEVNRRERISQPQFTRLRHRFKGQRESYKVNLEINQFLYDIHKLYELSQEFDSQFVIDTSVFVNGGMFEEVSFYSDLANVPGEFDGIAQLIYRVEHLKDKLAILERNHA